MKMSFSLSSLQPSSEGLERAEHARIRVDRPYNSLTKKRKEPMQEQCAKNWSGPEDSKDDFWAAIRTNYDYIMDTNLIDTCKEANGELSWDEGDVSTVSWGLKEVSCQFSELYSWLRVLQELVYSKEENLLDKSLRAAHTEELRRKAYRRRLFNEQAEKLIARAPSLKEEVSWRLDHLNAKWDLVEQIMAPVQRPDELDNQDVSADFEHEVKCLRKWLREMEARLQPLNFRVDWSRTEIEEKAMEHMVLQRDIEAHGRIVSSVVKLGERVAGRNRCVDEQQEQQPEQEPPQQQEQEHQQEEQEREKQQQRQQALRVASSLERRWHLLFLRALEWQCHIETLAARVRSKYSAGSSDSDDEEPVTKQPRLSRRQSLNSCNASSTSSSSQDEARAISSANNSNSATRRRHSLRSRRRLKSKRSLSEGESTSIIASLLAKNSSGYKSAEQSSSDSDASSENRSVDDGSYFEDDLDELCVTMNLKTSEASNNHQPKTYTNKLHPNIVSFGDQGAEADIEEAGLSEEDPDPNKHSNSWCNSSWTFSSMSPNPVPTSAGTSESSVTSRTMSKPAITDDGSRDEIDTGIDARLGLACSANTPEGVAVTNDSPKRRRTDLDEVAQRFNSSNRKSKNCATFYFKHMDTDSEADNNNAVSDQHSQDPQCRTEEEVKGEWAYYHGTQLTNEVRRCLELEENVESTTETDELNGNASAAVTDNNLDIVEMDNNKNSVTSNEDALRRERINKLVKEVEQLVRQGTQGKNQVAQLTFDKESKGVMSPKNNMAKAGWLRHWLEKHNSGRSQIKNTSQSCYRLTTADSELQLDSGDASAECTTDDSEVERQYSRFEDELSSSALMRSENTIRANSSDKEDDGSTTLLHQNRSADTSSPMVVMRNKHRRSSAARPWSVPGFSHIKKRASIGNNCYEPVPQHSISETALNKLLDDPTTTNSSSIESAESRVPFNNSTSTLLEEQINGHDARVARQSSLRRKKNRLRKKNVSRKSESGSDHVTATNNQQHRQGGSEESILSRVKLRRSRNSRASSVLSKSGSFSGSGQPTNGERNSNSSWSDSQSKPLLKSSSESEEEVDDRAATRAAAAQAVAAVSVAASRCRSSRYPARDESVLVGAPTSCRQFASLNGTTSDTENASFGTPSLEAWDNYQEKYSSETYSESIDHEGAKRILEFGDDYRNFLDSQSDASACSFHALRHRRRTVSEESASDSEVRRREEVSRTQLLQTEASYICCTDSNLSELTRVCRENIRCLRAISETRCGSRHSDRHGKQIRGLMERWESLSLRAEEAQKINSIHREMAAMKMEFCAAHDRLMTYRVVFEEPRVIEDRIDRITNELANLRDRKPAMLALNVSTHRLITDLGQKTSPTFTALKEGVADLYRLWDEAFQKGNQQLCALQAIQQFGVRLTELQSALRRDKDTLAVLDAALKAGATMEVASSVKDVARLLSEKHEVNNQQSSVLPDTSLKSTISEDSGNGTQTSFSDSTTLVGHEGGSLSDSGISDSGSEQELSERERRLAALRRLTRTLESQLMPESGDGILVELWRRVEEAEADLRALQSQCRELIVRTAASVEARANNSRPASVQSFPVPSKRKKIPQLVTSTPNGKVRPLIPREPGSCTATDEPDNEPSVPRSWVWRILRAALPFQLALVVLFCAACLLEPHCCEASNSLNLSLTPQLRYVRGPPPV